MRRSNSLCLKLSFFVAFEWHDIHSSLLHGQYKPVAVDLTLASISRYSTCPYPGQYKPVALLLSEAGGKRQRILAPVDVPEHRDGRASTTSVAKTIHSHSPSSAGAHDTPSQNHPQNLVHSFDRNPLKVAVCTPLKTARSQIHLAAAALTPCSWCWRTPGRSPCRAHQSWNSSDPPGT